MSGPRIALIHALEESVQPIRDSFARLWPDAFTFDLLDTSLAGDLAHRGALDEAMIRRFHTLADYAATAQGEGGDTRALLFTCSAFGPAIESARARVRTTAAIPVLKPNEAAFEDALACGSTLGLVVTFAPSLPSLSAELQHMAAERGQVLRLKAVCAEGALAALKRGDGATHDRLATEAAARLGEVDVLVLGQFSLARARTSIEALTGVPVITTPDSAVTRIRRLCAD